MQAYSVANNDRVSLFRVISTVMEDRDLEIECCAQCTQLGQMPVCLSVCLPMSVCLAVCLPMSVCLAGWLAVCLSDLLSNRMSVFLFI